MKTRAVLLSVVSTLVAGGCAFNLRAATSAEKAPAAHCVIVLDETAAGRPYQPAAEALARLRAPAARVELTKDGLGPVFDKLKQLKPELVAFVVPPERIEDNFVGEIFERASRLNDDPELDFAYGFITGATPEDALALVRNTGRAEQDRAGIPRKFVGIGHTFAEADLGPFAYQQALLHEQYGYRAWPINPIDDSTEWQSRQPWELRQLEGASLVYFAGHGMGDRICGIDADAFAGLQLDRAIIVSGPCHSAVTTLRHDNRAGSLGIKSVAIPPERSLCLRWIKYGAVAQVGSTASSSWGNVGPVVPGFFNEAKTMGEALRNRLNDLIRQQGIRHFTILSFEEGKPSPQFINDQERNPGGIQSLARVILIGDPAYRPFPEKKPILPAPEIPERPHPLRAASGPVPATAGAPAAQTPPRRNLSETSVPELITSMDSTPSADFAELNELIHRGQKAVPDLVTALKTSDNWQVAKALGAIRDPRAIDPLIETLDRRNWSPYREVAVEALELITGERPGTNAAAWKGWRKQNAVK